MSTVNTSVMKSRNSKYYSGNSPYGHFFWLPGKNRHIFSCKKTLVNKANFLGPNSGILTGFRCTTLSLSKVQVKLVQVTVFSINELKTFSFVTGR